MTDTEEIRVWWQKTISEEFIPSEPPESIGFIVPPDTSSRQGARAAEYAAAQLGQINRKLDKLIEAIDRLAERL
jgi:hypothetical protein